jgi:hypothetical protein
VVKFVHDPFLVLRRHAHDRLEDGEGRHPILRTAEVPHHPESFDIIGDDHIHDLYQGHRRGKGCGSARAEIENLEDLPPLMQMFKEKINVLISSRIAPIAMTAVSVAAQSVICTAEGEVQAQA